jgi:putative MATE family efflux protein
MRSALSALRGALRGDHHDYTEGSLNLAILLLAVPMVLEMAMESLFAICDIYFVAQISKEAVAAVGLTESMLTILYAVAIGIAMATTATVARRVGEKDVEAASSAGAQAFYVAITIGVVVGAPCWFLAPDLLRLMGASPEVVDVGSGYTRVILGANVVVVLLFVHNAIFRGAGDASVAMRSLWLANGVNIVLDPCLIFGWGPFPEMGVTGAGVATVCGRGLGVVYQLWALRRGSSRVRWTRASLRLDVPGMLRLLRLSVGSIAQFFIATASWVALMRIVSRFGEAAVAGYTIAIRIVVFTILPSWGLSNAAATLVGQNLGAGKPDRAERAVWLTGVYNMLFLGLVMVVFLALAEPLVGIFISEGGDDVRSIAVRSLRVMSYGYLFYAWGMVTVQAFNGAGDTMTPTRINALCYWVIQIPMAWLLASILGLGPDGVFWSVAIAESFLAVVSILVFRCGGWKSTQV